MATSTKRKSHFSQGIVAASFLGLAFLAVAAIDNSPEQKCVAQQEENLLTGAYEYVPERAADTARELCMRNNNVPVDLLGDISSSALETEQSD